MQSKIEKLIKGYESKIEQLQPSIKSAESDIKYYKKKFQNAKDSATKQAQKAKFLRACQRLDVLRAKKDCYLQSLADIMGLINHETKPTV